MTVTGFKLKPNWRMAWRQGPLPMVGEVISLDSYRPPQAEQPSVSKVLSRHWPPASLGVWGLGYIRKVDSNYCTLQLQKEKR